MNYRPPKLPIRFLHWFCDPKLLQYIEGDLLELYEENVHNSGLGKARRSFVWDVLKLFRPGIIRSFGGTYRLNQYGMLKNYFKVSLRNILRHKAFSLLNISGLSVGIACSILILIYVQNEFSYDRYHEHYDQTYRVLHSFRSLRGDEELPPPAVEDYQVWGNAPVAPALLSDFPEIETVFRFTSPSAFLLEYESQRFQENNIVFADSTAFDLFSWEMLSGDPKSALVKPKSIVLTKKLAQKYFGDDDPLGEMVKIDGSDSYQVTGVMEDVPANSHFSFDALVSMTTFYAYREGIFTSWGYVDFYTYFKVYPGANIAQMNGKIPKFIEKYCSNDNDGYAYDIAFEPLSDAYLYSKAGRQPGAVGSLTNTYIFSSVAIFLLLIACINFMNLSTSRSVERAKEVAIRKTIGSYRSALIVQFLTEAILLTFLSAILAVGIVAIGLPYLEFLSGKPLTMERLLNPPILGGAFLGVLFIGLLAGSYPAFVLSNFKPVRVLKGSFKTSASGVLLRKSLVVFQFALSIMLLVGTAVVYAQLKYVQNHELGFDSDQVLVIDYGWDGKVQRQIKYIKSQLLEHPDVVSVSASRAVPGAFFPNAGTEIEVANGQMESYSPALYEIDEDFIPTYEMTMAAGRNYSRDFLTDSSNSMIINEAAAESFGYADPAEAVGKRFAQWGREGKIVGVVKNFNYVSLHQQVEPLALRYGTFRNTSMLSLRIQSADFSRTLTELEETWSRLAPQRPFLCSFLDSNFNEQYEADQRFGAVFSVFAGIAIFIACLGLFGLTIYSTAQRTKEIGIRKVMGASAAHIVSILSIDFLKLFGIALLVAIPLSWYGMKSWLQDFAYSISIGWQVFLIAALSTLLISLITMSLQTVKAALANPVDSLRNE